MVAVDKTGLELDKLKISFRAGRHVSGVVAYKQATMMVYGEENKHLPYSKQGEATREFKSALLSPSHE